MRKPASLTVTISDNGAGLPADFDLDSTGSLGLQIVRTLVLTELHGRLEVSPRPGGGTQVLVELPLTESVAADAQEPVVRPSRLQAEPPGDWASW